MAVLLSIGKILAAIHEFGHFIMAKATGVRVNEFAIGMGPKLFSFGKGETTYTIRLFPVGGFCAMQGEDPEVEMPRAMGGSGKAEEDAAFAEGAEGTEQTEPVLPSAKDPRSFCNKKVWRRIVIVVAGAVMNLVLGFVLLLVYNGVCAAPQQDGTVLFPTMTLYSVPEDCPAYATGLRQGDTILRINGSRVLTTMDMGMLMQSDEDGVLDMVVRRTVDGEEQQVSLPGVTFELVEAEDGTRYLRYPFVLVGEERGVWNTVTYSLKSEYSIGVMIWRSLGEIITGKYGLNELSGPVGTVNIIGDAVADVVTEADHMASVRSLLMLIVMITVNLGVFNLLPIPGLDGGRLMFLIFEGVTRHPVPAKYEGIVHFVGLVLLMLFMLVVTFGDITKLFA